MKQSRIAAAVVVTGLSLFGATAHADVRYTTVMTVDTGEGRGKGFSSELTYFVKGPRERSESAMNFGQFSMKSVSITQCDSDLEIQIDPASKIYTAHSISGGISGFIPSMPMGGFGGPGGRGRARPHVNETPGTGTSDISFENKDLGKEKIGAFDTHHYMLTMHTKTTGCAGNDDSVMKMELWVAPGTLGRLDCPKRFQSAAPVVGGADESPCKTTTHMTGDMSAMRDLFAHLIVKQIIYKDDKPMMTMQLKDYSSAALDPSLFAVPSDFKKVSDQEYGQTQSRNMLRQFQGGANIPMPPANVPAPDAGAPPADVNAQTPDIRVPDVPTPTVNIPPPTVNIPTPDVPTPNIPNPADEIKKKIKIPGFHL